MCVEVRQPPLSAGRTQQNPSRHLWTYRSSLDAPRHPLHLEWYKLRNKPDKDSVLRFDYTVNVDNRIYFSRYWKASPSRHTDLVHFDWLVGSRHHCDHVGKPVYSKLSRPELKLCPRLKAPSLDIRLNLSSSGLRVEIPESPVGVRNPRLCRLRTSSQVLNGVDLAVWCVAFGDCYGGRARFA